MTKVTLFGAAALVCLAVTGAICLAQPDPRWIEHERTRPQPPVITPPTPSTQERAGRPPSDAVVLFDGNDLSQWSSMDGSPTKWIVEGGALVCVKGSGYVRTLQNFGDCQLHVEWAAPVPAKGDGQDRGNSGVFFGLDRYEVQVLDSFANLTYADGSAASVYGQYPPLVNASRRPGEWQTYDIVYTTPRFDAEGKLLSKARLTVFHNGVLVQNDVELTGPTGWLERAPYAAHPEKMPLSLQDHGNPVRFRNIWVRELGPPGKREFTFGHEVLDACVGRYQAAPVATIDVVREGDHLTATMRGVKIVLFAESKTKFFAKTTDLQLNFGTDPAGKVDRVTWSVGEGAHLAKAVR